MRPLSWEASKLLALKMVSISHLSCCRHVAVALRVTEVAAPRRDSNGITPDTN